jgi:long-chain acyl-CoA synthetase
MFPMSSTDSLIDQAKHIGPIPPTDYRVPYRNIRHFLSQHTYTHSKKLCLVYYDADGTRTTLSYGDVLGRASQIANYLHEAHGVRRGQRVATIAYNHSDTVLIYLACWLIGATVAPQNVTEDDRRIAYILRDSEAVLCLVRGEYLARAEQIIGGSDADGNADDGLGAPNIRQLVVFGTTPAAHPYPQLDTLIENLPTTYLADESMPKGNDTAMRPATAATPTLEDEALLVYTSGTTGAPKGVVLTQYNLMADAQAIAQWQGIVGGQTLMCVLPIHHVNGIVVTLMTPLLVGGTIVLNRAFSAKHFWERIVAERVSIVSVVPTLLQFLLEQAQTQQANGQTIFGNSSDGGPIHRRGLTHFRHFVCGAGTLSVALASGFENMFGLPILHGYGLSETTCYSCFLPIDLTWEEHQHWLQAHGYPSIGCPIHANEMAIFSADGNGQQLSAGERGEICVRGHNVMRGYYKRDDANASAFSFGWFRTGDEGFYLHDARGRAFFFISGRIKELINRGGVKFSPFDIEEVLLGIDGVKVALAVAFSNDYYGEEVGAYLVLHDGASLSEADVLAYCRARMSFEKAPKVVVFGTEIPVTTTGKYQRLKLAPLFADYAHTQFKKG